eukprot:5121628-Prymnesium_polylepis.2
MARSMVAVACTEAAAAPCPPTAAPSARAVLCGAASWWRPATRRQREESGRRQSHRVRGHEERKGDQGSGLWSYQDPGAVAGEKVGVEGRPGARVWVARGMAPRPSP